MKIKKINTDKKVFIIAEIGNNHEGNFNIAKKLVRLAAKAGADAVKFQTFKTENFINIKDVKRFKQLKKFELSYKQFDSLKKLAHSKKIKFISTPLDLESAVFLNKKADLIKIASGDNNFFPLIETVLSSNKPIIISTGMTSFYQIQQILNIINSKIGKKNTKKRISLLHCVTNYPVANDFANLRSIVFLNDKIDLTIGYSDHTIGQEACIAAVALGARIIEKHFTLNKNFSKFRDHALSADYIDLKNMITSIRKIEKQLGIYNKKIQKPEKEMVKLIRRSGYSKKKIKINKKLNIIDINFFRPALTENFLHLNKIVGKRVRKTLRSNDIIKLKNLY